MRHLMWVGLLVASAVPALAMDGPSLPSSAKKLTKDEIIAMMQGKTFNYKSYNHDELKTGKTTFDFKKMTYSGTYSDKGKMKSYTAQPLSMNSEAYCYDKTCPEGASAIYGDGSVIYEMNGKGKVGEVLTK